LISPSLAAKHRDRFAALAMTFHRHREERSDEAISI